MKMDQKRLVLQHVKVVNWMLLNHPWDWTEEYCASWSVRDWFEHLVWKR